MLGNGPHILGNGPCMLVNGTNLLGNGPHVGIMSLGIMSHLGICCLGL